MAATPNPPEAKNPRLSSPTAKTAGTRTGLNITNSGVTMVRVMTVAAKIKAATIMREPPAMMAVATLTSWAGRRSSAIVRVRNTTIEIVERWERGI
ncbi:hypothetical protein CR513_25006, partial [Mucuna pruriens]